MADRSRPETKAAYGGPGWRPRTRALREETGTLWAASGIDSEYGALRHVVLHRPGDEILASLGDYNAVQMLEPLDLARAQQQHDGLASAYKANGVTVHYADPVGECTPNQMFMADLLFLTPEGAILARPASEVRAGEERWAARRMADLGIPIVRTVHGHGTFEGADAMWIDPQTVLVGRGLRTNDEAFGQIKQTLNAMGADAIQVELPYGTMHLMGMLRIVDRDLALAWPTRLSHRGVDALRARGLHVAFIPDEREARDCYAFNTVTLGPRKLIMPSGCPVTQRFYEGLGIECVTVDIDELGKACGSIGCLTGVLHRDRVS